MKKLTDYGLIYLFLICFFPLFVKAQQINTLYFMENVPIRHILNPAFQPLTHFYLSLPVFGFTQLYAGNNSIAIKDIIYNYNGQTISFLNKNGDIDRFYKTLKATTVLRADLQTNLMSFGFKQENMFWNFSLTEKIDRMVSIPKDLFLISLYGTPDRINNTFKFNKIQGDMTTYTELALGFATQLDEQWSVGVKIKYLYGNANASNTNRELTMEAGIEKWILKGEGSFNVSAPVHAEVEDLIQWINPITLYNLSNWFKLSGMGAGIDLGLEYRLTENISFSGAIIDFGFIRWNRNVQNFNYTIDYTFDGIEQFDSSQNLSDAWDDFNNRIILNNELVDSMKTAFQTATTTNNSEKAYNTYTTTKLNLGVAYNILNDRLGFGLLSRTQFFKKTATEEITASINARPYDWLNTSISYSSMNGSLSTIGAGFGLRTGFIHWFAAADYIPFRKSTFNFSRLTQDYPDIDIPIPYNSKSYNLSFGINLVFDEFRFRVKGLKSKNAQKSASLKNTDSETSFKNNRILNTRSGLYRSKNKNDCHCE